MKKKKKPAKRRALFSHHSKTAKLLPRKHTSYPMVALLLLMVGVLLIASTVQAMAATIDVHAEIAGTPPPTDKAVILSPANGQHLTGIPVPVTGTCQVGPGYFVKLFRNDIFSGSAACTGSGTFTISSDLFAGQNKLTAYIADALNRDGPVSDTVTVFYDPPVVPPAVTDTETGTPSGNPVSSGTGHPKASEQFYVSPDYYFAAAFSGQTIKKEFKIIGGQKPYTVSIIWGDGNTSRTEKVTDLTIHATHIYTTKANMRTYFPIIIEVRDARGVKASLQVFAILNDPTIAGLTKSKPFETTGVYSNILLHHLMFAWPAYVLLLVMALCFWLGERRGYSLAYSTVAINRRQRRV
jgi:hypothetical protein